MAGKVQEIRRLHISVAMCTYNGGKYLREQLISIAKQTRLPDELIVCDDVSTDATLQILDKFQKIAPLPIRIHRNGVRLGVTKNFEQAIALCSGDVIALSDQDDVWMQQKLERLERVLKDYPEAGYVFSNALVVDEILRPLGYTVWEASLFTARQRRHFNQGQQLRVLLRGNVVLGAAMLFHSELRKWVLPIPEQWVQDAWIPLIASATGARGIFIEEPLVHYRQHSEQLIGCRKIKIGFGDRLRRALNIRAEIYGHEQLKCDLALERLVCLEKITGRVERLFRAKKLHLQTREWIFDHSHSHWIRFVQVFRELLSGRYFLFSNGWKAVAQDLLIVFKRKNAK